MTIVKHLKSAVNKEYLNAKFLKKDKDDNYFDLRQNVIKNTEPYYDGLFGNSDLISKVFVDAEIPKLLKPELGLLKIGWLSCHYIDLGHPKSGAPVAR